MYRIIVCFLLFPVFSFAQSSASWDFTWATNKEKKLVDLSDFRTLLPRDGIPPIDSPSFWGKEAGDTVYFEHEPVISVSVEGTAKAYPLSVLMFHEIVNDRIAGRYISVTYCPLCNAAIVFNRRLEHEGRQYLLDFGVSGMLRKSDLVMWDRQTESWWQQFTGEALVGKLAGAQLDIIPSTMISYASFFRTHPGGLVLSTRTGHDLHYGKNPYVYYDDNENTQPRLFDEEVDERLPAMERIVDVEVEGRYKVYPLTLLREKGVVHDKAFGREVVLFYREGMVSVLDEEKIRESRSVGSAVVYSPLVKGESLRFEVDSLGFRDQASGSLWNISGYCVEGPYKGSQLQQIPHGNHFAFAWFAFRPESEVYGEE